MRSRDLPEPMIESINQQVALIHAAGLVEKAFAKQFVIFPIPVPEETGAGNQDYTQESLPHAGNVNRDG